MKAARVHALAKPLSVDEVPIPEPGPGEVLLQVKACGVCSSDRYVIDGKGPHTVTTLPHTPGHEVTGIVAATGDGVAEIEPGDRVFINPMVGCGRCEWCLGGQDNLCVQGGLIGLSDGLSGGYAEYMSLPARNVHRLPDDVTFEQGVIITSVLATAFHAVRKAGIEVGDTAAVFGMGSTGCAVAQCLKAHGAGRVIGVDLVEGQIKRCRPFGVDEGINSSKIDPVAEIMARTGGRGVDVAFDLVGDKSTIEAAIGSVRRGGRAVLFGTTVSPVHIDFQNYFEDITHREASIAAVFAYQADEFPMIVKLLESGSIDLSLYATKTFPLAEVNAALDLAETYDAVRIILAP